jgi:uncharacterized membrane protein
LRRAAAVVYSKAMRKIVNRIAALNARQRLAFSIVVAAVAFVVVQREARFWTASIAAWDTFALTVLLLAWIMILVTRRSEIRKRAQAQDLSATLIFIFAVAAACASLIGVGFLLHSNRAEHRAHELVHFALVLVAVGAAWSLTHTVFGLRYAHTFYGDSDQPGATEHAGGLDFPGERLPDYLDFAYFSFVIGMTFQVSDVQITSREIRRLVLVHGILSFGFNTVVLALAINTASSLF